MWRHLLAMAVVAVGGLAVGQDKESERKRTEAYLKKHPTEIPELAALAEKADETLTDLMAAVKVSDEDKPAVRAAKRSLLAENERRKLTGVRIRAGQFANGLQYVQWKNMAVDAYNSAALIWTEPEKVLPFAECMAAELLNAELFGVSQVESGLQTPELLPQVQAARLRAEVTVLKLREQVKKK